MKFFRKDNRSDRSELFANLVQVEKVVGEGTVQTERTVYISSGWRRGWGTHGGQVKCRISTVSTALSQLGRSSHIIGRLTGTLRHHQTRLAFSPARHVRRRSQMDGRCQQVQPSTCHVPRGLLIFALCIDNTHPRWHRDPALRMNVFYG
jgi:hypothetical protein